MERRRIDLHTHSRASDGTDTPAQLMRRARAVGLDVVALTDHDGFSGWEAAAGAVPPGLTLIPGVELSAAAPEPGPAGERKINLHLLGYLVDASYPPLAAECAAIRESRVRRARRIVQALTDDGHLVDWERIRARVHGSVGRPHIAQELVAAGLVDSVSAAFTPEWIGAGGRYYLSERKVPVLQAIGLIRAAGGVAVFAHPGAHGRGATVSDQTIAAMSGAGLAGLEVDHPDHDAPTRARLRSLAGDLGLLVTGSSDYHGDNKPIRLGAELTAEPAYEAILAAGTGCRPVRHTPC